MEALAAVSQDEDKTRTAAVLWGGADALRESIGGPLPPIGQAQLDERLAKARASLGDASFDAAWAEGRALSWEKAVEFALREA